MADEGPDLSIWQFSDNWTTVSQIEEEVRGLKAGAAAPGGSTGERPNSATSNMGRQSSMPKIADERKGFKSESLRLNRGVSL